jgi:hypothetical protein
MKRVSQVLQLPVIIKCGGPFFLESQLLQKGDFILTGTPAERSILEEFSELRLFLRRGFDILGVLSQRRHKEVRDLSGDLRGGSGSVARQEARTLTAACRQSEYFFGENPDYRSL